jgi:sugar phosphate isomerase/epimerase
MTSRIGRRQFIRSAGVGSLTGAGLALSRASQGNSPAAASHQFPRLLIGCTAFSFGKVLAAGKMTMEDFILKCVEMGVLGAELTAYWLKSTDRAYLLSLRHLAFKNGVTLAGVGSGPDSRLHLLEVDKAKRREAQEEMKRWVDITEVLGASHMRIFAGSLPEGVAAAQGMDWAVESMKAVCEYSATKGITLGVETHGGIALKGEPSIELIRRVDSPYAGLSLDIQHLTGDPDSDEERYKQIEACVPYTTQTHITDRFDNHRPIDLERVWQIFSKNGFRGYMSLEYNDSAGDVLAGAPRMIEQMKKLSKKYSSV